MGPIAENPILIDKVQDKENSPPSPPLTIPLPMLMRRHTIETKIEIVSEYVRGKLLQ